MIKVEGLTKRYARTLAVDDISFEVEKGQIVGFLGPNGAGKTTTMRVLTCFLPPTAGKCTVADFDVVEHSLDVKKRIGYLPETPPLYPEMEVHEYVTFVGKLVATDTVSNLTSRLRGSEMVAVEVESNGGVLNQGDIQQRLEQVPGVSRVLPKDPRDGRYSFELESLQGRHIRPEVAKAVV